MPNVEPPKQTTHDGRLATPPHDEVPKAIGRLVREGVRRTGTRRETAELLFRLGWPGRNGEQIAETTVTGWVQERNIPNAGPLFALLLHHGISVDEVLYGSGLRSEVDRLSAVEREQGAELEGLRTGLAILRDVVTSHLSDQLGPEQLAQLNRIAAPPAV